MVLLTVLSLCCVVFFLFSILLYATISSHNVAGKQIGTSSLDILLLRLPSCVFVLSGGADLGDGGTASLGPGKLERILIYSHFGGAIRPKSIPSLAFLSLFNTSPFL